MNVWGRHPRPWTQPLGGPLRHCLPRTGPNNLCLCLSYTKSVCHCNTKYPDTLSQSCKKYRSRILGVTRDHNKGTSTVRKSFLHPTVPTVTVYKHGVESSVLIFWKNGYRCSWDLPKVYGFESQLSHSGFSLAGIITKCSERQLPMLTPPLVSSPIKKVCRQCCGRGQAEWPGGTVVLLPLGPGLRGGGEAAQRSVWACLETSLQSKELSVRKSRQWGEGQVE